MFIDKITIKIKGGDGGNGCASFRREKYVPKGGPNGGDGGKGGDIVIEAVTGEQSLIGLYYKRHYSGERGKHGQGNDKHGRSGKNVILKVPAGTVVKDIEKEHEVVCDLDTPGKRFVAAHGGKGGKGNKHFVSSINRTPKHCEEGRPGEEKHLEMELKTIADIGLVGYPNAGKSTLLGSLSAAAPKAAPYPFTTLQPTVGIVEFQDFFRISIADIPGLIEGAHNNVGLGHKFLKHIERTKVLLYVIDMSGLDGRNPFDDYISLKNELEQYQAGLSDRPSLIAANKIDLVQSSENLKDFSERLKDNIEIIKISAIDSTNLNMLLNRLRKKLESVL
ncbi:MAG: GTPase ObgE [Victivallales bacterium]|nr:GTPase ObgE [Victivallales bacterium]